MQADMNDEALPMVAVVKACAVLRVPNYMS